MSVQVVIHAQFVEQLDESRMAVERRVHWAAPSLCNRADERRRESSIHRSVRMVQRLIQPAEVTVSLEQGVVIIRLLRDQFL